jgi:hypothetical protein
MALNTPRIAMKLVHESPEVPNSQKAGTPVFLHPTKEKESRSRLGAVLRSAS